MSQMGIWSAYCRWYGEAMCLMMDRGDKAQIIEKLEQARRAVVDLVADLPPEGTSSEADMARRVAATTLYHVEAVKREVREQAIN